MNIQRERKEKKMKIEINLDEKRIKQLLREGYLYIFDKDSDSTIDISIKDLKQKQEE